MIEVGEKDVDAKVTLLVEIIGGVGCETIWRVLRMGFDDGFGCWFGRVMDDGFGGWMMGGGRLGGENALSMASCNPIDVFSGCERIWVVATTGDTGGSSLTDHAEAVGGGSGEVELPGVGSCERPSAWDGTPTVADAPCSDLRLNRRSFALHHIRTWTGFASRPSAQRS